MSSILASFVFGLSLFGAHYSLVGTLILVLDIIAIVAVLAGGKPPEQKILWILVVVLLPVIGLVLYFLLGRDSRDADVMRRFR